MKDRTKYARKSKYFFFKITFFKKWKFLSRVWLFVTPRTVARQAPLSMGFSSKNTGVGCHGLLQEVFPTQGSNLCSLHFLHWQADSLPLAPPNIRQTLKEFLIFRLISIKDRRLFVAKLWHCGLGPLWVPYLWVLT